MPRPAPRRLKTSVAQDFGPLGSDSPEPPTKTAHPERNRREKKPPVTAQSANSWKAPSPDAKPPKAPPNRPAKTMPLRVITLLKRLPLKTLALTGSYPLKTAIKIAHPERNRMEKKPMATVQSANIRKAPSLEAKLPSGTERGCYCWFARDVTAAMLVVKNKSISLLWELISIFM